MDIDKLLKTTKRSLKLTFNDHDELLTEILEDSIDYVKTRVTSEYELYNDYLYNNREFKRAVIAQTMWDFKTARGSNLAVGQTESPESLPKAVNSSIKKLQLGVNRLSQESRGEGGGS